MKSEASGNGLSDRDMENIRSILSKFDGVHKAAIFGSRSLGTYHSGSDIDIALLEGTIDDFLLAQINSQFAESSLPYKVDLIDYTHLQHLELKEHIDRAGKVIFEKLE
jgi:uncharacterized protein